MSRRTKLRVIELAADLAVHVYESTGSFPSDERFGIIAQARRSAISVGSNLSEGSMRSSDREFARFAAIALGSLAELEFQLRVANRLGFLGGPDAGLLDDRVASLRRQISALRKSLLLTVRTDHQGDGR